MSDYEDSHLPSTLAFVTGWRDLCGSTLDPGNWLLIGEVQIYVAGQLGAQPVYAAIYDEQNDEYHCLQYKLSFAHWSQVIPVAAIIVVETTGDYNLRVEGGATHIVANPTVAVPDVMDPAGEPFFNVLPSGESTHLTAINLGDADYVIGFPTADVLMPAAFTPVEVCHVDLPHSGSWLLITTATFMDANRQADAYYLWHQGPTGTVSRYIESTEVDFFDGRQAQYQIHGVVTITGPETWKTMAQVDAANLPHTAMIPQYKRPGAETPGNAALMLAVEVSPANVRTQLLTSDLPLPSGVWKQGPTLPLEEGTWFIMGTAHYFKESAATTWIANAEILDMTTNTPYRPKARWVQQDPTGEAMVVNVSGAIIIVPDGQVHNVALNVRVDGSEPGESLAVTKCVAICPTTGPVPGPEVSDPSTGLYITCEDYEELTDPEKQAKATCITAIKLPLNKGEIAALGDYVRIPTPVKPKVAIFRKDVTPV